MTSRRLALTAAFFAAVTLGGCSRSGPSTPSTPPTAEQTTASPASTPDREAQEADGDNTLLAMRTLRLGRTQQVHLDTDALLAVPLQIATDDDWDKRKTNKEKDRGPKGTAVYKKAAPSIVVVKTRVGHGTGSIIDKEGWVVTNHHVIAKAEIDPRTGAPMATIYMGKVGEGGFMELDNNGLPAEVRASSKQKDLALLKILSDRNDFPALEMSEKGPEPQEDVYSIGHPKSGMLWTVREGQAAGSGSWPGDGVNSLTKRVSANAHERQQIEASLASGQQLKIVMSNCGINFGDSGGPLLNGTGQLCAVTFAMPTEAGTGSFAYHIALSEVKEFLKNKPNTPAQLALDPWPAGAYHDLFDLDGDGTPDALGIATSKGGPVSGLMLDLKQRNAIKDVKELADQPRKWHFDLAVHFRPHPTAYYDRSLKGNVDLIITDLGSRGIHLRKLESGNWKSETGGRRALLDPQLFTDPAARERLTTIAKQLQK